LRRRGAPSLAIPTVALFGLVDRCDASYTHPPMDEWPAWRHIPTMRRVLLPVLGAVLLVAVCSALVADCAHGGYGNGASSGEIPGRYP